MGKALVMRYAYCSGMRPAVPGGPEVAGKSPAEKPIGTDSPVPGPEGGEVP